MNLEGFVWLAFLCVAWDQVSAMSFPAPQVTITNSAMDKFESQVYFLLNELTIKVADAHRIYATSHSLKGDSSVDLLDFFVDAPPSTKKWICLKPSKRLSKCVRTLKAFMTPLKTVLEDEKQLSNRTGDTRAFNTIRMMRAIWLQSTYRGLQRMANQSKIALDDGLKMVKLKTLDRAVQQQSKALGNWPPSSGSPTVLRNYAILEALLNVMIDLNDVCQVYPTHTCAGGLTAQLV